VKRASFYMLSGRALLHWPFAVEGYPEHAEYKDSAMKKYNSDALDMLEKYLQDIGLADKEVAVCESERVQGWK